MPELQVLKTLIFPRALYWLKNWLYFIFSYLKFFSVFIINARTIPSVNMERLKHNLALCGLFVVGQTC